MDQLAMIECCQCHEARPFHEFKRVSINQTRTSGEIVYDRCRACNTKVCRFPGCGPKHMDDFGVHNSGVVNGKRIGKTTYKPLCRLHATSQQTARKRRREADLQQQLEQLQREVAQLRHRRKQQELEEARQATRALAEVQQSEHAEPFLAAGHRATPVSPFGPQEYRMPASSCAEQEVLFALATPDPHRVLLQSFGSSVKLEEPDEHTKPLGEPPPPKHPAGKPEAVKHTSQEMPAALGICSSLPMASTDLGGFSFSSDLDKLLAAGDFDQSLHEALPPDFSFPGPHLAASAS